MSFRILVVCTGNICRSPAAERLLAVRLAEAGVAAEVSSAGTFGLVGRGIDPPTAAALTALGHDASGHAARRIEAGLVRDADLILTAEAVHRAAVVQLDPLLFRRTFTLREFARLGADLPDLDDLSAESLRKRVKEVAGRRGWVPAPPDGADDIEDPYGASDDQARQTVLALNATVAQVIAALGVRNVRG